MSMNKRLWFVLGFIVLVVATQQFSFVHCRVLKSDASNTEVPQDLIAASSIGMTSFPVSSYSSSTRSLLRGLTFRLASGPSKRGRGH
ncbi:hypothetical protein L6164_015480 [Bauhinia variegata]|uniref:Uncharacterized protein n=1 Tax=Bauhinia variegata TaxID=167791 RepID=A0ACB9NKF1_BAUVA|nr:hypothetical protein L6164_015480 [Bauhinia variegata]